MKRPNLTEGKWTYQRSETDNSFLIEAPHQGVMMNLVAECFECEEDAQAISQVPNLIDELIDDHYVFTAMLEGEHYSSKLQKAEIERRISGIDNALEKAGVQIEETA